MEKNWTKRDTIFARGCKAALSATKYGWHEVTQIRWMPFKMDVLSSTGVMPPRTDRRSISLLSVPFPLLHHSPSTTRFFFFFLRSAAFLSFPFQCFFLCFFSLSFLFSRYATTTGRGTILDGRKRNGVDSAVTRETWSMRYLLAVKVAWKRLSRVRDFSPSFRRKNRYLFFAIFAESLDLNFSFFSYSP